MAFINTVFKISLPMDPRFCILNDLEAVVPDKQHIIAVTRCLFHAGKLVVQRWMASTTPTLDLWVTAMNHVLKLEKYTYQHRGAFTKFEKLWAPWLDAPGLASLDLICDRLLEWKRIKMLKR